MNKQIEKALVWIKAHPEKGYSLADRVNMAAWRFAVDPIDLLAAVRDEKNP